MRDYIMWMKNNSKRIHKMLSFFIVFAVWKVFTLFFPPFVVPTISSVFTSLLHIFSGLEFYQMIGITVIRLTIGLTAGIGVGLILGIIMGYNSHMKGILSPIIGLFQTIPPVSWVVLALVWFGFNGRPAIFIVITSTFPIIAINICEGISNIEKNLLQMAQLYRFSQKKRFMHVVLPSIMPYFHSAFQVALGSGWKIAVMGEVLTTSDGIGGMIKLARLNIEPENIIAWSIVIVMLFYLSDFFCRKLFLNKGNLEC
ncbi:NitT/TauT family transport system permease protein [[Clostridium] propionicum DSM 1682]|uniref:Bicarbonate transport system permease protein CmpB n=2 Tax=Anaerotignum propionicum TaxID=28446 RepID=A0A0X1U8W4_ANAPI|nr:bicarbonate transport system permease protein CmpB [Anaerotignum propionicum DSM 1682]SHE98144.1 NitT/TauT family transport system permease protein [[Clostridium] propionicum DSM 1682] [Anaerotignum propionicum DSM 1682]